MAQFEEQNVCIKFYFVLDKTAMQVIKMLKKHSNTISCFWTLSIVKNFVQNSMFWKPTLLQFSH